MPKTIPEPGTLLADRYRVEELLGRGGMGAVLAAVDEHLGRPVALKWMLPETATSERGVSRFFTEARAMARIEHPNVLEVFDVGYDGAPFLVMERLRGESLESRLKRSSMPIAEALDSVVEAARGVAAAHAEGIVHRDLKPANIFLCAGKDGERREAKVLDFGVAKLIEGNAGPRFSVTGLPLGTQQYMSPQQLNADPPDPTFDVYALGVVLYEALAGRPPYGARGLVALVEQVREGRPEPLTRWTPHLPTELDVLVRRAMHRDPSERPSLEELLRGLQAIRSALSSPAEGDDIAMLATLAAPVAVVSKPKESITEAPPTRERDAGQRRTGPGALQGVPVAGRERAKRPRGSSRPRPSPHAPRSDGASGHARRGMKPEEARWSHGCLVAAGSVSFAVLGLALVVGAFLTTRGVLDHDDDDASPPPTSAEHRFDPAITLAPTAPDIATEDPDARVSLRLTGPQCNALPFRDGPAGAFLNAGNMMRVAIYHDHSPPSVAYVAFIPPEMPPQERYDLAETHVVLNIGSEVSGTAWTTNPPTIPGVVNPIHGTLLVHEFEPTQGRMRLELRGVVLYNALLNNACAVNGEVQTFRLSEDF